jgi:hypothetical protein
MPKKPWIPSRKTLLGRLKIIASRDFPYKKGKRRAKGVKQEDTITRGHFIAYLQRLGWFDNDEPETGDNYTGMDTIAEDMGVSLRTAHACRAQAEEWGLVTRTPRAMYTTSISKLIWDAIEAVPARPKLQRKPIAGKPVSVARKELTPEQAAKAAEPYDDSDTTPYTAPAPKAKPAPASAVSSAAKAKPEPEKPQPEDPRIQEAVAEIMGWTLKGDTEGNAVYLRVNEETGKRFIDTYGNKSVHSAITRLAQKYPAGDLVVAFFTLQPSQRIAILNGRNPPGLLYDLMEKNLIPKVAVDVDLAACRYFIWKRTPNMQSPEVASLADRLLQRINPRPLFETGFKQEMDTLFNKYDFSEGIAEAEFDDLLKIVCGEEQEEQEEEPDEDDREEEEPDEDDREEGYDDSDLPE